MDQSDDYQISSLCQFKRSYSQEATPAKPILRSRQNSIDISSKNVRFNPKITVIEVENWKPYNVDTSKESKCQCCIQ